MGIGWNALHTELRLSMQKEVTLMRDLLTNLHQEELSLLMRDRTSWNQVMEERATLVRKLSSWRSTRIETTQKLHQLHLKAKADLPLEELLPSEDENSCEVLTLRDQIAALTERMNRQNSRNQLLQQQAESKSSIPLESLPPQSAPSPQRRKRTSVMTYPEPRTKDRL